MSGGHWQYRGSQLEIEATRAGEALSLIAEAERALDWGLSGDTCADCAVIRVGTAVIALLDGWFEGHGPAGKPWQTVIRDQQDTDMMCERCRGRETRLRSKPEWSRAGGHDLEVAERSSDPSRYSLVRCRLCGWNGPEPAIFLLRGEEMPRCTASHRPRGTTCGDPPPMSSEPV